MNHKTLLQLLKKILGRTQAKILSRESPIGLPKYGQDVPSVALTRFRRTANVDSKWDLFFPILIGPDTIGAVATCAPCLQQVIQILRKLEPDSYVRYLLAYYEAGLSRFGEHWRYADITTALLAASQLIRPEHYLEIGVRRGRSMAMVAATCPEVEIVGFDMWVENYGDMENPGLDFVRSELRKVGFKGRVEFVSGDSHRTVPEYFREHPDAYYDLITVDGDHSLRGASLDLRDVLPRLKIGGAIVFDDIGSPQASYLKDVWRRYVASQPRFASWEFDELGFGIAIGIRKY